MTAKKIFLGLMIALLSCAASWADVMYTTTNGDFGLIEITSSQDVGAPSVKYRGMGESPLAAPYWDGEKSCAILIDRTQDINASSGDMALLFYATNLSNPINTQRATLTGVYDTQAVSFSPNGQSIFFASYGNGTIREFNAKKLVPGHSYTHRQSASDDIYTPHALGVRAEYYSIYTLMNVNPNKSLFIKFDGQLKRDVEDFAQYEIKSDAYLMTTLNNGRYVFACPDGVRILQDGKISKLLSTDYPVTALCQDKNDGGFYFITQEFSDGVSVDVLSHYSSENKTISHLDENESGMYCELMRDASHDALVAITGDKILVYSMYDDLLIAEFDSAALGGGKPVSVARNAAGGYGSKNSGGNCEISGAGIILLLLCGKKFLRKK